MSAVKLSFLLLLKLHILLSELRQIQDSTWLLSEESWNEGYDPCRVQQDFYHTTGEGLNGNSEEQSADPATFYHPLDRLYRTLDLAIALWVAKAAGDVTEYVCAGELSKLS